MITTSETAPPINKHGVASHLATSPNAPPCSWESPPGCPGTVEAAAGPAVCLDAPGRSMPPSRLACEWCDGFIWVFLLLGRLHLRSPSPQYRRDARCFVRPFTFRD